MFRAKIIICAFFSLNIWANFEIEDDTIYAAKRSITRFALVNDGSSTSHEVYVPMEIQAATNSNHFVSTSVLPQSTVASSSDDNDLDGQISLDLKNTSSSTINLYAFINSSGTYSDINFCQYADGTTSSSCTSANDSSSFSISSLATVNIVFDMENVCEELSSGCLDGTDTFNGNFTLTLSDNSDPTNSDAYNIDIVVNYSAEIPSSSSEVPTLSVQKGDAQVDISYNINDVNNMDAGDLLYQLIVLYDQSGASSGPSNYATVRSRDKKYIDISSEEAQVTVDGFANLESSDPSYYITIGLMNKFQFVSFTPASVEVRPAKLETFIQSQSCYLISAGFKRNHYVLDYLRKFRDNLLMSTNFGKTLVQFYYETAPQYAMSVAQSPFLSFLTRSLGHTLYVLLKFWYLILIAPVLFVTARRKFKL